MTKDEWYDNLDINDTLTMKAPNQQDWIALKTVWVTYPTPGPILKISQGMWGMKDFSCLGFLGSVSKTVIKFGATYTNCVPTDVGKMVKANGEDTSVLAAYDNVPDEYGKKTWWLAGSASVASGSSMTIVDGQGAGTSSGDSSTGGGGAILMDSAQGHHTLHLKKFDGTPAHLDLGDLTAHGQLIASSYIGVGPYISSALGRVSASGTDAEFSVSDRNAVSFSHSTRWVWYSQTGAMAFWRNGSNKMALTPNGQLQLPIQDSSGGLQIGNDVNLYRGGINTLYVYRNIEPGAGTDTGYLGEGGRYWFGLVSRYVYYKTLSSFDQYDDLNIAKLWGEENQKLPEDYDRTKLKPPLDDPFKIIKGSKEEADTEEFFDAGKVSGFLMGCVKALAKKQDEHDALLLKLLNEVESLRAQIAS
jgi:hypothetical protein